MNKNINEDSKSKMSLSDYTKMIGDKNSDFIRYSIKEGQSPLLRNWDTSDFRNNLATNPKGQNIYKGLNVLMLDTKKAMSGFKSNQWLTFKQATELGGKVKQGSDSMRVFFTQKKRTDEEIEEFKAEKRLLGETLSDEAIKNLKKNLMKYYPVFNIEQINFKDTQIPKFIPQYEPKKVDMKLLEEISKDHNEQGMSIEYKVLRNQIAKYIISKDFGDIYNVSEEQKEVLKSAAQKLQPDDFQKALIDGSKMSFEFFKANQDLGNHQDIKKEENSKQNSQSLEPEIDKKSEAKEAMQYFRENKIEVPGAVVNESSDYQVALTAVFDSNAQQTRRFQRQ